MRGAEIKRSLVLGGMISPLKISVPFATIHPVVRHESLRGDFRPRVSWRMSSMLYGKIIPFDSWSTDLLSIALLLVINLVRWDFEVVTCTCVGQYEVHLMERVLEYSGQ